MIIEKNQTNVDMWTVLTTLRACAAIATTGEEEIKNLRSAVMKSCMPLDYARIVISISITRRREKR